MNENKDKEIEVFQQLWPIVCDKIRPKIIRYSGSKYRDYDDLYQDVAVELWNLFADGTLDITDRKGCLSYMMARAFSKISRFKVENYLHAFRVSKSVDLSKINPYYNFGSYHPDCDENEYGALSDLIYGDEDTFENVCLNDQKRFVDEILLSLDQRESTILYCLYFNDLTLSQTADIIGITEGQVCRLRSKIFDTIRTRYHEYCKTVNPSLTFTPRSGKYKKIKGSRYERMRRKKYGCSVYRTIST